MMSRFSVGTSDMPHGNYGVCGSNIGIRGNILATGMVWSVGKDYLDNFK